MKTSTNLLTILVLSSLIFLTACSDDDNVVNQDIQIELLKDATAKYMDHSLVEDEGRIDVSGYVPNMGHHYMSMALVDKRFELTQPEIILYVPDNNGVMQMVGVEYSILPESDDIPGNPPEGFLGDNDVWKFNESVGHWQLHVWTILDNPEGIFEPYNTAIGD